MLHYLAIKTHLEILYHYRNTARSHRTVIYPCTKIGTLQYNLTKNVIPLTYLSFGPCKSNLRKLKVNITCSSLLRHPCAWAFGTYTRKSKNQVYLLLDIYTNIAELLILWTLLMWLIVHILLCRIVNTILSFRYIAVIFSLGKKEGERERALLQHKYLFNQSDKFRSKVIFVSNYLYIMTLNLEEIF